MKKIALFATLCGLTLVGAAPPAWESSGGYPPCSATVTDRCIQLYERDVATPTNLALNERLGPDRVGVGLAAVAPAYEPMEEQDELAANWSEFEAAPEDPGMAEDEYAANWSEFETGDDYAYAGGGADY